VMNGLKIFEFRLQHSRRSSLLIWRDSCLLLPIRLDGLKGTFDLDCPDKPFFPYGFNRRFHHEIGTTNNIIVKRKLWSSVAASSTERDLFSRINEAGKARKI
jgi:hypothetical protein